jgi:iron complex transport system ATP-binding protein
LIEVIDLSCGYAGVNVLADVNFHVTPGSMTGVLGPNGSGKTTLLLTLSGSIPIKQGTVTISGDKTTDLDHRDLAKRVASVVQRPEFSFPYKCLWVVLMGRYPYVGGWGGYSQRDMNIALEAMKSTNCLYLAERSIAATSGGEAQTVSIARALAQDTPALLLDEATSHLDAARKIEIFDLFTDLVAQGKTIITVMHDLNLAALYCSRLIFMKNGRIALDGPTWEVFNDGNLSEIYETDIKVSSHPVTGHPQAHFMPGRTGDTLSSARGSI